MSTKPIIHYPDSLLRKECDLIDHIDDEIYTLAQEMAETMYQGKGIGLAAPQIGITKKLIVVDIGEGLITLINPVIEITEGTDKMEEGCLCLPSITCDVERALCARVTGLDLDGKEVAYDAQGLLARVFQHELDHLKGTLIIDHLSKIKRDLLLKKYKKQFQQE